MGRQNRRALAGAKVLFFFRLATGAFYGERRPVGAASHGDLPFGVFPGVEGGVFLFGNTMELLYSIMTSVNAGKRNYFILDGNYDAFHYLTCDHRGEVILQLLCHPAQRSALDGILQQNLSQKRVGWPIDHDAVDESGNPVLFGYSCDMPRILRFDTALELQGRTGTLICFDFQEPVLRRICCQRVTIHSIDFEKFERSVFHS